MRQSILIFGHGYATQFIDISNQYTRLFDPEKYEVHVVYLTGKADEAVRQRHLAEHVYFLDNAKQDTRGLKLSAIKTMMQLQKEKKFQIVICHRYKPSFIMMCVAQFYPIRALFFVMHELKTMSNLSRKLTVAALIRKNMYFAGVSNAVRDDLRHDIWGMPAERIITLYNMIDVEATRTTYLDRNTARAQLHLAEDSFVFGTLGRLVKAKDQRTMIEGFALVKKQCPMAKLVIIGEGDLEQELRAQISDLGLENEVILTGFIPQGFRLLKAFDVFVLTSIKEAFGRVLLESMIARVPIIASRTNGIPEVVGDAGQIVEPRNKVELAEKMLGYCHSTQDQLKAWADRGEVRAVDEFSLQKFNEIFWGLEVNRI